MTRPLHGGLAAVLMVLLWAAPAAADPPTVHSFEMSFEDVDPCRGLTHTVTFTGEFHQHQHGERFVEQGRTVVTTTPTGYVGRGNHTLAINENILVFRFADMLASGDGDRIRVRNTFVMDLSTGAVRVEGPAHFTCVGQ